MNAPTSDRWPFPPTDQHPVQPVRQRAPQPAQYHVPGQQPQRPMPGQQQPVRPGTDPRARPKTASAPTPVGRRLLGVVVLLVLTLLSLPVHVAAVFFVYLLIESPGDATSSMVLVIAAFTGSFIALLVTGILSQLAGGFPAGWRARVTFAACSAVLSLGAAYLAAIAFF